MRKRLSVRVLSLLLVFAMMFSLAAPAGAVQSASDLVDLSFTKTNDASGVADESLAVDDETALGTQYDSEEIVRVSIVLEKKPTIEAGFSTMGIGSNASAMAYRADLEEDQIDLTARIEDAIGESLDVQWNLTLAANIISADVTYGQIDEIAAVDGVRKVVIEQQYEPAVVDSNVGVDPNTATSGEMIGSSSAYALGYTGAGSRIAIIDTGLDMDHQSFSAEGYEYSLSLLAAQNRMTLPQYKESLDLLDAEEIASVLSQTNALKKLKTVTAADLYKTEKVPFAFNYVDKSATKVDHTTDAQGGHGSHVAGIAAANRYIPNGDGTYSVAVDSVSATGVAPDAQIIVMKVFGAAAGPYESDYMAAIEDAILLGCDSVNLSLGSNTAGPSMSETYQELMESLQDTDTTVVMSAGNNGHFADYGIHEQPGYLYAEDVNMNTGGSPGSYTNSLTVASADNIGTTGHYLSVDEQLIFYTESVFGNALLRTIAGEHEYIFLDSIGTAEEWAAVADVLPGKIAICSRGTTSFFEKAEAAVNNGAIATIIYNNQPGSISMDLSTYTKKEPCVSITQAEGAHIMANSTPVTDEKGRVLYYTGTMTISAGIGVAMNESDYYTMSSFSSYGVNGSLELKPEITAPGGSIYSVDGEIDGGKDYVTMSGTSMAAPQISGMAAILGQYIEEQGLEAQTGLSKRALTISLLMSTAEAMEQSEGQLYPVFRQGAGLADIGAAVNANSYVLMGEDATDSWDDGKVKAELGDDPDRTGVYEFSFTLNNLTDSDQLYMLSSDLFTQDTFTSGEYTYMGVLTEALQAEVKWTVNGEMLEPAEDVSGHDVTGDGLVNTLDVQAIVDYKVGNPSDLVDLDAADVNGDGDVTTYDAYLLLDALNTGLAELAANGTTEVTVSITLTDDQKARLDETFENGAYIQGYFSAKQLPTADGELGTVHSIPMLAFYGRWSDARMFEYGSLDQYYYGYEGTPQYTYAAANSFVVQYDDAGSLTTYYYAGNPYSRLEDENPIERWAVKPSTTLYQTNASLIRAAGGRMAVITDQTGEVLYMSEPTAYSAAYYYPAAAAWQYTSTVLSFRQKVGALGAREGDVLTVYDLAIPEYYTRDGGMTGEQLWSLYKTGVLNEGAANRYSFTVDSTAPEMVSVQKDLMTGALTIRARDNNYVASVQVQSPGGTVFASGLPEQEGKNETGTVTIDLSEYQDMIGEELMIVVCDYAMNESAYVVEYGNDPMDYSGKMFAFTESKYRGGGQRWMYIDPAEAWFNNRATDSYGYGGTLNMQLSDVNIQAAEYVGGYVYMAGVDGNFYVAEQGDWSNGVLAGRYMNYTNSILDLAFNYADGKLYALDSSSTIWTVDLETLVMTRVTTIELYFPFTLGFADTINGVDLPGMMAIDDEGTFYLVNRGSAQTNGYLFSFTAEDIGTGIEEGSGGGGLFPGLPIRPGSDPGYETNAAVGTPATGLHPVNDTREGYLTYWSAVGSLAWDHDADILYMTGSTGQDATGYSSYILTVDTETGLASQTNSITGGFDMGCPSRLQTPARALYIVPSQSVEIGMLDAATSVGLDKSTGKALTGAQFPLTATVYPWNVTDRSVTWTTSDETIATVNADGVVSVLAEGEVTITATSNLTPACSDSCTITVETMPSIQLTALVTDSDGVSYWSEFTTDDPSNVHKVKAEDTLYFAGTLSNGMIIAHNNAAYFGIDPDTFESLGQLGALGNMFRFSDCAESPAIGDRFGTEVVSVANSGTYFEVLNYETHRVAYVSVASTLSNDPMATIAYYRSSGTSNYYYVLTEGGQLWSFYVTQSASGGYSIGMSKVGDTGMSLPGVNTVTGGSTASMIYDQETGYLFIISSQGASTELYALDPVSMVWSNIGSLAEGMYPAVALYRYERDSELSVKVSQSSAYLYMDGTLDLDAAVLPVDMVQGVTWSSSDASIATVDQNGVVTPVAPGTVDIIATTVTTDAEGSTAQGVCTVKVKDVTSIDAEVKAQIRNDDGTADWVTIDLSTMDITVDKKNSQFLYGGGVHDGMIYGTDMLYEGNGGNYYSIDPSDDYAVVTGVTASDGYGMLDGTTAPGYTMQLLDAEGDPVDIEFFGDPMVLNHGGNFFALYDHVNYSIGYGWGLWNWYSDVAAVAYMGTGTQGMYTSHLYYFLAMDGNLYSLEIWPDSVAADGSVVYTSTRAALGKIGVSFASESDLTMTYVRNDKAEGLVIGNNGANNAELYYVDLTEPTLTCGKMAELEGTMSISTLYTDAEMNGTIGAYTTESVENVPAGETAAIMVAASTEYVVAGETEVYGGGLNAVKGTVAPLATETGKDCAEGIVELTLTADGETGNGLYTVEFDTTVMTLTDVDTTVDFYSVLAENGSVTFGYANAETLSEGGVIAKLTFQATEASTVTVTTAEDGDSEPNAVEEVEIPAPDHTYEASETVEPTCTADGYTVWVCSACGDTYTEVLEATGHTLVDTAVEPTCVSEGYTQHDCSVCGISYRDSFVDALGHSYEAVVTEATCTTGGWTTYTCANCGHSYTDAYVDALGHDWSEWTVTVEATHETAGEQVRTCQTCGETQTEVILPTGHTFTQTVVAPTCETVGYTRNVCECGHEYITDVVEALGHDWSDWTVTTEPTCDTDGEETRTCAACGAEEKRISAHLGHSYTVTVVEPTCTEGGYTYHECAVCGDSYYTDLTEAFCPSGRFTDVELGTWYHEAVDFVVRNGLMKGMSETIFAPGADMNRAQIVTVLYRLAGSPAVENAAPFTDVPADSYYGDAVAWAYANGIVKGVSDTQFNPNASVTREQMVTFLGRYAVWSGETVEAQGDLSAYIDGDTVSAFAVKYMTWAVESGLINGITADTLVPAGTANRAQVAVVLMRFSQE